MTTFRDEKGASSHARQAFEEELRRSVRGEVHFEDGYRAMYSTDAANYRQIPIAVVLPKDADDAQRAMQICSRHGVPVTPRGGGTSLTGASCNVAVIFDYSKFMNRVLEVDYENLTARVQSGVVLDDLRNMVQKRGLTFGPAPSTHNRCAIGGMFGNNSCGMPAQFAGRMEENVFEAEVLLYDGTRLRVGPTSERDFDAIVARGGRQAEIYQKLRTLHERYGEQVQQRFPDIPRRVSGYNLHQLAPENGFNVARALIGSEGTIVHVLELTVRLVPQPPFTSMALLGFDDIATCGDYVPLCNSFAPRALEGLDESLFQHMEEKGKNPHAQQHLFPDGHAWLMMHFGGDTKEEAHAKAQEAIEAVKKHASDLRGSRFTADEHTIQEVNEIREAGLGVNAKIPNQPEFYPGWEDAAVAPEHLGKYLREFQQKMDDYGYIASVYGHFGQGCVHCRISFDLFTKEGIEKYRRFVHEMAHIVVKYEGSISGEHGDGQIRGELLPIMFGDDLVHAFWEFKTAFDPLNKMNPGKVVRPRRIDEDLRWGVGYEPWDPPTKMRFKEDGGSFAYAANRCVGAGVCRKHDKGTMCPSYMASKEEKYSTRGRARMLFEMLQRDPIKAGWKDDEIKDSLEYCLACKACKHECPVNVDMATYKAEFLHHYYEGRVRPLQMWLFGYMFVWARLASRMPAVANFFSQAPPFSAILKRLAKIAPQRKIPMFADHTFRQWFDARPRRNAGAERVMLWVDTWNNYFHPHTAQAAVEVLEDAGYEVIVPPKQICCGRPLYDYGMLDQAQRQVDANMEQLRPFVREGVNIVGLEPSCLSVFKDELQNMVGYDPDATRLATQCYSLDAFLKDKAEGGGRYDAPKLDRSAIVHEHCHKKSLLDPLAETHIFDRMALDHERLESGCCGMAGAFGFEAEHYSMSIACGERVLLPKVRDALPETLVVADGFSCREQIMQTTNRRALHPAEVLRMAIDARSRPHAQGDRAHDAYPERRFFPDEEARRKAAIAKGYAVLAGAAALIVAGSVWLSRRKR